MLDAIICEKMGWTYDEYLNTPLHFIELLTQKWEIDAKKQKLANK